MQRTKPRKRLLIFLSALLLLACFALPSLAASANVEAVLSRLSSLQRADINPDWPPDIVASQTSVEGLLSLYLACSSTEKGEFTADENAALRAYFEALYKVQGKDVSGIDGIFSGAVKPSASSSLPASGGASSTASVSSGGGALSSSNSVSSEVSTSRASSVIVSSSLGAGTSSNSTSGTSSYLPSSAASTSLSGVGGGGVSTASSQMDATSSGEPESFSSSVVADVGPGFPPQIPKGEGWMAVLGNRTLGAALLLALIICLVMVVLRFLLTLRAAHKGRREKEPHAFLEQELFGENYDGVLSGGVPDEFGVLPAEGEASLRALRGKRRKKQKQKANNEGHFVENFVIEAGEVAEVVVPLEAELAEDTAVAVLPASAVSRGEKIPRKYNNNTPKMKTRFDAPTTKSPSITPASAPDGDVDKSGAEVVKSSPEAVFALLRDNPLAGEAQPLRSDTQKPRTGRVAHMPYAPEDLKSPDDLDAIDD